MEVRMEKDVKKGYSSIEDHMQDCIEFFRLMQMWEENDMAEENEDTGEEDIHDRAVYFRNMERNILEREFNTDIFLPAVYLRQSCRLNQTEYWLVLFAFACELEEGLCLAFRRKSNGTWPDIQYALHLLSTVFPVDFTVIAEMCGPGEALWDILRMTLCDDRGILMQPLLLNRTVFYFLLTGCLRKKEWCDFYLYDETGDKGSEAEPGKMSGEYLNLHDEEYNILARCLRMDCPVSILLNGPEGSGKHTLIERFISMNHKSGILLGMLCICNSEEAVQQEIEKTLNLLCRMLKPVIVMDFKGVSAEEINRCVRCGGRWEEFIKNKRESETIIIITDENERADILRNFSHVVIDIREYLYQNEKKMALDAFIQREYRRTWQEEMLGKYRLSIGKLSKILKNIGIKSENRGNFSETDEKKIWIEELQGNKRAGELGKIIEDRFTLDDLVVPQDCLRQLEMLIKLSETWIGSMDAVQGRREGFHMLFHGSSGTGKTMAASVIASHLHMPLFKVDLSRMFDKYIGETEKHMDEIFRVAEQNQYILFFDEADALFSRRTDIKDSHDKYSNISTAYLLQRMESFDGILILATNLMNNFDDAFLRRIRFVIKFRNPDEKDRAVLWDKLLAGNPPSAPDVSSDELAGAAELSPARIKAVVQTAKMLAASERCRYVTRQHLQSALELEAGKDETIINGGKRMIV